MPEADIREEWEEWRSDKLDHRIVMAIAMADASDPKVGLEEQTMRLRLHNRAVAELLEQAQEDADEAWGRIEKYLKAGVLITASPKHVADVLKLAVQVMKTFDDRRDSGIRPMVGITRGEV